MNTAGGGGIDIFIDVFTVVINEVGIWKNNQGIWRHKASTSHSRDVTDQPCLPHNRSTMVTSQCKVRKDCPWQQWRDEWLMIFWVELCVQDIKYHVRNKIMHLLPWSRFLDHSWCDLPMIFTCDFIAHENHWWIRYQTRAVVQNK